MSQALSCFNLMTRQNDDNRGGNSMKKGLIALCCALFAGEAQAVSVQYAAVLRVAGGWYYDFSALEGNPFSPTLDQLHEIKRDYGPTGELFHAVLVYDDQNVLVGPSPCNSCPSGQQIGVKPWLLGVTSFFRDYTLPYYPSPGFQLRIAAVDAADPGLLLSTTFESGAPYFGTDKDGVVLSGWRATTVEVDHDLRLVTMDLTLVGFRPAYFPASNTPTQVPLPAGGLLLGAALVALGARWRR